MKGPDDLAQPGSVKQLEVSSNKLESQQDPNTLTAQQKENLQRFFRDGQVPATATDCIQAIKDGDLHLSAEALKELIIDCGLPVILITKHLLPKVQKESPRSMRNCIEALAPLASVDPEAMRELLQLHESLATPGDSLAMLAIARNIGKLPPNESALVHTIWDKLVQKDPTVSPGDRQREKYVNGDYNVGKVLGDGVGTFLEHGIQVQDFIRELGDAVVAGQCLTPDAVVTLFSKATPTEKEKLFQSIASIHTGGDLVSAAMAAAPYHTNGETSGKAWLTGLIHEKKLGVASLQALASADSPMLSIPEVIDMIKSDDAIAVSDVQMLAPRIDALLAKGLTTGQVMELFSAVKQPELLCYFLEKLSPADINFPELFKSIADRKKIAVILNNQQLLRFIEHGVSAADIGQAIATKERYLLGSQTSPLLQAGIPNDLISWYAHTNNNPALITNNIEHFPTAASLTYDMGDNVSQGYTWDELVPKGKSSEDKMNNMAAYMKRLNVPYSQYKRDYLEGMAKNDFTFNHALCTNLEEVLGLKINENEKESIIRDVINSDGYMNVRSAERLSKVILKHVSPEEYKRIFTAAIPDNQRAEYGYVYRAVFSE